MDNYLFEKIKKIAKSYGIDSDEWCKKELRKWEYYDSWSDKFDFEKFIRNDCRTECGFMNHYGMDYDETIHRIGKRIMPRLQF